MNTLNIERLLSEKYSYCPLPNGLSDKYRNFYLENIPNGLNINGGFNKLYSINNTLICNGYNRIVIGDYGAFIEFDRSQANSDNFIIKQGQEYRIFDKKFSKHVKYHWYTTNDESDIKIYYQIKKVTYADYLPKMYYVSPHEIELGVI